MPVLGRQSSRYDDDSDELLDYYDEEYDGEDLPNFDDSKLSMFEMKINEFKQNLDWSRSDLVKLFHEMIPDFGHKETGKFLDQRM